MENFLYVKMLFERATEKTQNQYPYSVESEKKSRFLFCPIVRTLAAVAAF